MWEATVERVGRFTYRIAAHQRPVGDAPRSPFGIQCCVIGRRLAIRKARRITERQNRIEQYRSEVIPV